MVFSSPLFLFLFLPAVLALYFAAPLRLRNTVLLAVSLLFYAWGEPRLVAVMLVSILVNHAIALRIQRSPGTRSARALVAIAVVVNIGFLAAFKYAGWLWDDAAWLFEHIGISTRMLGARPQIRLPIGISFFTFHALSAVIDVYRREARVLRNPIDFALYIACFPQLIAGPIIRYHDVSEQIVERRVTRAGFAYGVRRFVLGLGKKVLIANIVAVPADAVFGTPAADLGADAAWLGIAAYTLQIYFDFSGYSDMAIGLGRMLGFTYRENFLHPYASRSVTEFWRRWHVSLSTWFRDYLYIPLGGNRLGEPRTYLNLVVVFFLCGLWHGASWTFVVWGLYHGACLVIERLGLGALLERVPGVLRRAVVMLAVMVGWVFFRSDSLAGAARYLGVLFDPRRLSAPAHPAVLFLDPVTVIALVAGILGCAPWAEILRARRERVCARSPALGLGLEVAGTLALALLLAVSAFELSSSAYNPFIYFRF